MLPFLLLTIAIIVYGSLFPFHFQATARDANPLLTVVRGWPAEWDRYIVRDVLSNVIVYVPVGLAATILLLARRSRAVSAAGAILLAFALSLTMETLQVFEPTRDPSSLDVVSNVTGGALGAVIALAAERRIRDLLKAPSQSLRGAAAVLLSVWVVQEFYPFFPAIGRGHIYERLHYFLYVLRPAVVETWLGAAEWFAVGLALTALFAGMRTSWLAGLMAFSAAAQLITADHYLTVGQILSAGLALTLWQLSRDRSQGKWCAWLLASAVVLRELQPFYFLAVPRAFSWVPFAATLDSARTDSLLIIVRKAFDYGAIAFALRIAGWSYVRAGLVIVAGLAGAEAIQTYLPGRTPEITDPLLALIMVAILRKAGK